MATNSVPSRQRKLGPAPFASFEDLSDDNDPSPPQSDACRLERMPEIKEDGVGRGEEEEEEAAEGNLHFGPVTLIPSVPQTPPTTHSISSVPNSGPTSALQTPSTPRIDISCASSSTPPSEDSNSERELFQGGLGLAFQEDGTDDLRSSTEELEFGHDDDIHDERTKKEREREKEELLRRASHPGNIFNRNASTTPTDPHFDLLNRKPSAHSLYLEGFLSRPCRHSSFGSADRQRPRALSSLSDGRRSASPHKMLLETSFCGNKPIPTPSLDLESPPKTSPPTQLKDTSHPTHLLSSGGGGGGGGGGTLSSDSSFESHHPERLTTLTTVQVHHHHHTNTPQEPPDLHFNPLPPHHPTTSHKAHSPESPKSSDHWKPISPKPQLPTPKSSRKASRSHESTPPSPSPSSKDAAPGPKASLPVSPNPSSSLHLEPMSPKPKKEPPKTAPRKLHKQRDVVDEEGVAPKPPPTFTTFAQPPQQKPACKAPKSPKSPKPEPPSKTKRGGEESKKEIGGDKFGGGYFAGDEITTEMKIEEDAMVSVEDVPTNETKGFFLDDSLEDGEEEDLPYVPTTLPQEKPAAVRILGVKERRELSSYITTTPTQRPRCRRPPNPASLNDYIQHSISMGQKAGGGGGGETEGEAAWDRSAWPGDEERTGTPSKIKMKINLPRDDSLPDSSTPTRPKSPKKKFSTTWTDFAEMGLRSPREIRRRMREEMDNDLQDSQDPDDTDFHSYQSDSSLETAGPVNGEAATDAALRRVPVLSDEETESLLKLPRGPFANDLDVSSTRSSLLSQEDGAGSPVSFCSAQMDIQEDDN